MKYNKLGNTGFDVSALSFGTWQIGGKRWNTLSDEKNVELLQRSQELGVNLFDVAVVYGQYKDTLGYHQSRSQELLGRAFLRDRNKVYFCLKLGQFDEYSHRSDCNPNRIIDQFQQSLRRLDTDYIDICLIHAPPITEVKSGKAITILKTLRALGDVRAIGYSFENEPDHVEASLDQDIDVLMLQYNMIDDQCRAVLQKTDECGIGVIAGGPFKRGYLTGKYQSMEDISGAGDDYWEWNLRHNPDKVRAILDRVNSFGNSPKILREKALDFILSQPIATALVGHRSINEVKENIEAIEKNGKIQ